MTIELRIIGWKVQGLRCPDHEINCCNSQGVTFPITLIQMPNGTGKTTTLELLRAALSGSAEKWTPDKIKEFRKRKSDASTGTFTLQMLCNNQRLTILMEFNFDLGNVEYKTTWGQGQRQHFEPPRELRRFMNPSFVKFYVFDGEYAEHLMNPKHTDASTAIESLFQLDLLGKMKSKVVEYWEVQTRDCTAKDKKGFNRRKNKLDSWKNRLIEVELEKHELDQKLIEVNDNLTIQSDNYRQEIEKEGERAKKIETATNNVEELKRKVQAKAKEVLDEMRDPSALSTNFAKNILDFKGGLDRVKLPANTAKEFFQEIASELECICGRPIDTRISNVIKERAEQYLGSDDMLLLNEIKSTIASSFGESDDPNLLAQPLSELIDSMSQFSEDLQNANNDLHELHVAAENTDPAVKMAAKECKRLEKEKLLLENDLRKFEHEDSEVSLSTVSAKKVFSIETLNKGIKRLEHDFSEAADTLTLKSKRDVLTEIIDKVKISASEAINSEICEEANQRIQELMPYNNIRIQSINKCLVLEGQAGSSVGETLSVGYAFLATLFKRAEQHELPFIVDSPANPIDLDNRARIGELVPHLAEQFIAFMISSERERFLDKIRESKSASDINYITLFNRGIQELDDDEKENTLCLQISDDGVMITGKHYFDKFQLDTEGFLMFAIRKEARKWFRDIKGELEMDFDMYYFCFIAGISNMTKKTGVLAIETADLTRDFPGKYRTRKNLLVALFLSREMENLGVTMDEKELVHETISVLVKPGTLNSLSDEGVRRFNDFAHGGFDVLSEIWFVDDRPHSLEYFLRQFSNKVNETTSN